MYSEMKKYFEDLNLVRQDIREEFDLLGVPQKAARICDFGCGNGMTTFGLALEAGGSECVGIDLFDGEENASIFSRQNQYAEILKEKCALTQPLENIFPGDLCKLVHEKLFPRFVKGNILLGQNLSEGIDVAYCKKVLFNIWGKNYGYAPSGEDGLLQGLKNIAQSLRIGGLMYVIEYDNNLELEKYLEMSCLQVVKRAQTKRREIRSDGRTNVISPLILYLCRKSIREEGAGC